MSELTAFCERCIATVERAAVEDRENEAKKLRSFYIRTRVGTRYTDLRVQDSHDIDLAVDTAGSLEEWIGRSIAGAVATRSAIRVELMQTGKSSAIDNYEIDRGELVQMPPAGPDGFVTAGRDEAIGGIVATNVLLRDLAVAVVNTNGRLVEGQQENILLLGELKGKFEQAMLERKREAAEEIRKAFADATRILGPHLPAILQAVVMGRPTGENLPDAERRDTLIASSEWTIHQLMTLLSRNKALVEPTVIDRLRAIAIGLAASPSLELEIRDKRATG